MFQGHNANRIRKGKEEKHIYYKSAFFLHFFVQKGKENLNLFDKPVMFLSPGGRARVRGIFYVFTITRPLIRILGSEKQRTSRIKIADHWSYRTTSQSIYLTAIK